MSPLPPETVRRLSGDVRVLAGATAYVLLLQVAHPTVAAGVRDHSDYRADPFGRYFRSLDYLWLLIYSPPEQAEQLRRDLRDMHRPMRGTDPQGRRYSALEPSAYAWVHATTAEGALRGHHTLGGRLSWDDREQFWREWRALGEVLGIRSGDLPETWTGLQRYLAETIDDVLEDSDVVRDLLEASRRPRGPSPLPGVSPVVMALAARPLGYYARFVSFGMMPPRLREKLGIGWGPGRERVFRGVAAAQRAATPLLPARLRNFGPVLQRWRKDAVTTGPFARTVGPDGFRTR